MKGIDDAFLSVGDKLYAPQPPMFLSSTSFFLFHLFARTIVFQDRIQIGFALSKKMFCDFSDG
jgi:hypothetical protein